eukprot:253071_1
MKSLVQQLKCGFTHPYIKPRALPNLPIDFTKVCHSDPDLIKLRDMDIQEIENVFKTTPGQFTKEQLLKRCFYVFKLKFQKYDTIQNEANESQQKWFQYQVTEAMDRPDWNNDYYNTLHDLSLQESENTYNNMEINNIDNTMKWLNYIGLSSTQPWTTRLAAKIVNDLILDIDNNNTYNLLDVGCGMGKFPKLLNNELLKNEYKYLHKINVDGIDISLYCIEKAAELKEYRQLNQMDLSMDMDVNKIKNKYQFVVSCDVLQQSGFGGLPGTKCIEQLMDLVDHNGYFVIINSIISTSYNCISFYNDVLNNIWIENGFQVIGDLQLTNIGGFVHAKSECEANAFQKSCIFAKIMKKM